MKRILGLILVCCILGAAAAAGASGYVFEGEPTYEYLSDDMTIGIQRVQENGVTYFLADVTIHEADHLDSALASRYEGDQKGRKSEPLSDIAQRHDAVLAINADNFNSHGYGLIIREGQVLRQKDTTRHLMAIDPSGDLEMYNERPSIGALKSKLLEEQVKNTFEFGPVLVQNGLPAELNKSFKLIATRDSILEPRTAIGQLGPLHYLVIVVDGRRKDYSKGMNLRDLQGLFLQYHVQSAFNLDGGGSTTLYFKGEVINRPSGGRQRAVSDILYFK